jgi:hypothetical protein
MTQTNLTSELNAHLHAGGHPIRFISADEMAYYQARASLLRAEAINIWIGAGARGIASLFRPASVLPNRRHGGKLVTAE